MNCEHNTMVERVDDPQYAWQCADCGYVYGLEQRKPLFTGLNCLPGQQDLFPTDGEPSDGDNH